MAPAMINLDLSKALHSRFLDLFPAFMPGLFFEISIFLACPQRIQALVGPAHLERYLQIIIALVLAFVIGHAFMCWVRLIQTALWFAVRRIIWLWIKLLGYFMNPKKFPPLPPAQLGPWRRFIQAANFKFNVPTPALRGIQDAWAKAAVRLLKMRYGIDPPRSIGGDYEWGAWESVLGLPKPKLYRGLMLVYATHATGWSGLAAAHLAPALRNFPYLTLSWFMVVYGIIILLFELRRWTSNESVWTIRLYSVLDEIPKMSSEEQEDQEQGDDIVATSE